MCVYVCVCVCVCVRVCVCACVLAASPDDKDQHSDEGQGWWHVPQYCHPCRGDVRTDADGERETGAQKTDKDVKLEKTRAGNMDRDTYCTYYCKSIWQVFVADYKINALAMQQSLC